MKSIEKQVAYTTTNTYSTLNELTVNTKTVWIVLHGIGYLSRYFLKYFDTLPPEENYIIAPQAPSKYYLNGEYRHVGASWLTKEKTLPEAENVYAYLDALFEAAQIPKDKNLLIFGFSQGVSIATRWVAKRQLNCQHLVLYAGGMPKELTPHDFAFLEKNETKVTVIVGDKDEYLTAERLPLVSEHIKKLFHNRAKELIFDGRHEVKKELINQLV